MIELTEQQRRALLDGQPVELTPAEIGRKVVLLRADAYEEIREILQEERTRKAMATVAGRNAAARMRDEPLSNRARSIMNDGPNSGQDAPTHQPLAKVQHPRAELNEAGPKSYKLSALMCLSVLQCPIHSIGFLQPSLLGEFMNQ
jgi:hypothetical protein